MKIRVGVASVDGSNHCLITENKDDALIFLEAFDHEGAVVDVAVVFGVEEAYVFLGKNTADPRAARTGMKL